DTLNLINAKMGTLDPIAATGTASGQVIMQIYDALMNYKDGTTTIEPLLAKDYTVSDDFTTYEFKIHPDATFHNGDPITASDVRYSFERLAASKHSRRSGFLLNVLGVKHETKTVDTKGDKDSKAETKRYKPKSIAVEAIDKKTVRITLQQPFHAALQMLAYGSFAIVPEGVVGDIKGYEGRMSYNKFQSAPEGAGSGPFKYETFEPSTEAAVSKYEDYYGNKPNVDRVHWQVIEKDAAQFTYIMEKNADLFSIPSSKFKPQQVSFNKTDEVGRKYGTYGPVRNGETLNMVRVPLIVTFYVGFNMEKVPKPVRKAMAYVMNQGLMVDEVFKGRGKAAFHFVPPGIWPGGADAYTQHAKQKYPYGYNKTMIDKAAQVMEEAGYGPDNKYTMEWTQYQSTAWKSMAKILQRQLGQAHIDMNITQARFTTLLTRGRKGQLSTFTLGWIADWPSADNFLQLLNPPMTQTEPGAGAPGEAKIYTNWQPSNGSAYKEATQAYNKIERNQVPTEQADQARAEATYTMEEANWEDVSMVPVYHSVGDEFWYDRVTYPTPYGGMGRSRQRFTDISIK
ncbi:MAG: ABC transporter substrate-binding protein, partial [Halobacteriaceae archaeon]